MTYLVFIEGYWASFIFIHFSLEEIYFYVLVKYITIFLCHSLNATKAALLPFVYLTSYKGTATFILKWYKNKMFFK